ncbi:hypothetical protein L7F22_051707 [Adiantum nelumboides]|nr:hypothetical protein [Adiantum nelumboides]
MKRVKSTSHEMIYSKKKTKICSEDMLEYLRVISALRKDNQPKWILKSFKCGEHRLKHKLIHLPASIDQQKFEHMKCPPKNGYIFNTAFDNILDATNPLFAKSKVPDIHPIYLSPVIANNNSSLCFRNIVPRKDDLCLIDLLKEEGPHGEPPSKYKSVQLSTPMYVEEPEQEEGEGGHNNKNCRCRAGEGYKYNYCFEDPQITAQIPRVLCSTIRNLLVPILRSSHDLQGIRNGSTTVGTKKAE